MGKMKSGLCLCLLMMTLVKNKERINRGDGWVDLWKAALGEWRTEVAPVFRKYSTLQITLQFLSQIIWRLRKQTFPLFSTNTKSINVYCPGFACCMLIAEDFTHVWKYLQILLCSITRWVAGRLPSFFFSVPCFAVTVWGVSPIRLGLVRFPNLLATGNWGTWLG